MSAQTSLVSQQLSAWLRIVEDSFDAGSDRLHRIIKFMMPELIERMCCTLPALKADSYQHEVEWRLIAFVQDLSRPQFRAYGPALVPYIDIELSSPKLPITKIIIGPNCPVPDRVRHAVGMLLTQCGYSDFPIVTSAIQYRHSNRD